MIQDLVDIGRPDTIGRQEWLNGIEDRLQQWLGVALKGSAPAQAFKDFLNGTWLGHPLHPALTDVPIGAWWSGMLLDILGIRAGADAAIGFGTIAALPTALTGLADWSDTYGRTRRVGLVHGALNVAAFGCYVGSLAARRAGRRILGLQLSTAGLSLATYSAWLGGDLVFAQGNVVNHAAWAPDVDDFAPVGKLEALPDGQVTRAATTVGGEEVPLVLLRQGTQVYALANVCTHAGGPLAEGALVDGLCVQCPWHGSIFDFRDGRIQRGPATIPQPAFEVRVRDGNVEVRRLHMRSAVAAS